MRSLKDNVNIIKQYMVKGCVDFYIPYYLDGEDFIKQIHVPQKDIEDTIEDTKTIIEDFDSGLLDDLGLVEGFIKNTVLSGIMELEEEPTANELKFFQYIADIIVGQPNVAFKMAEQITENGYVDDGTIEEGDFKVYDAILEIIMSTHKMAEFEEEVE